LQMDNGQIRGCSFRRHSVMLVRGQKETLLKTKVKVILWNDQAQCVSNLNLWTNTPIFMKLHGTCDHPSAIILQVHTVF
jgi:hypothetical protein